MNTFKINCNALICLIFYCNLHFYKIAKIFFSLFVSNIKNAIFFRHFMCFLTEFLQLQEAYGWVNRGSERLSTKHKISQLLEFGIHIRTALRKKVSEFLWEWWLKRESTRVLQSCPLFHGNEVQPQSLVWFASVALGFPGGSVVEAAYQCLRHKMHGFNPWVGKIPWRRNMATHSSILTWKVPWTRGTWWATVHGVTESKTRLSTHTAFIVSFSSSLETQNQ